MIINIDEKSEDLLDAINNGMMALNEIRKIFFYGLSDELPGEWYKWYIKKQNSNSDKCYQLISDRLAVLNKLYNIIDEQADEQEEDD